MQKFSYCISDHTERHTKPKHKRRQKIIPYTKMYQVIVFLLIFITKDKKKKVIFFLFTKYELFNVKLH